MGYQLRVVREGLEKWKSSEFNHSSEISLVGKNSSQLITHNSQHTIIKKIYDSQLGVREQGFNTGPEVEEYLRYVNLEKGQPWCAAFICWVYGKAGIANPRSGWSPDLFKAKYVIWNRGKEYQVSRIRYFSGPGPAHLTPENPQPRTGDIFGIFFSEKRRIAHAGFIDRWDEPWLVTVEGNTNLSGSPEGDGVYRKRRLVRSIYQVARYWPERTSHCQSSLFNSPSGRRQGRIGTMLLNLERIVPLLYPALTKQENCTLSFGECQRNYSMKSTY